jgi:hypothetical protein
MRIRLGRLKQLLREAMHNTMVAYTQPAQASPESMRGASHPSLASHDPVTVKTNQVMKVLQSQGKQVNAKDVKKLLSTVNPKRLLVLSAEDLAKQVALKLAN